MQSTSYTVYEYIVWETIDSILGTLRIYIYISGATEYLNHTPSKGGREAKLVDIMKYSHVQTSFGKVKN